MDDATRLPALQTPDPLSDPANLAAVNFLGQYLNRNTRSAYSTDLRLYFAWCSARGLHPLRDIQRAHVHARLRQLAPGRAP